MDSNLNASLPEPFAIAGNGRGMDKEAFLRKELVASPLELTVVLFFTIGLLVFKSGWMGLHGSSGSFQYYLLSNRTQFRLLAEEVFILGCLLGFLRWRGWRFRDFNTRLGLRSSLAAFLVLLTSYAAAATVVYGLIILGMRMKTVPHLTGHPINLNWGLLVGVSIFNAFFEELTTMAYAFNQFAVRYGPASALILTVLLRVACHTYQGWSHLPPIGALFLVFGAFYIRKRNLWPLILAHAVYDIVALGSLKIYLSH